MSILNEHLHIYLGIKIDVCDKFSQEIDLLTTVIP